MANTNDLVDRIINDAATREKISNIIARSNPTIAPIEDLSILEDSELQYGDLTHLLTLAINGNVTMKEQKVVVDVPPKRPTLAHTSCIRNEHHWCGTMCYKSEYYSIATKRATIMMYVDIHSLIIPLSSPEKVRGVAAFQPAAIAGRFPSWRNDIWYTYHDVGLEDHTYVNKVSKRI
ncbi:hypothetical protein OIU76_027258 [Salix suchowensis]|nr:hypothetical protein OIU76_027258 [Salix suchowensis]